MLTTAIKNAGGQVLLNTSVQNVVTIEQGYTLNLNSPNGQTSIDTHNVVVACGGKPIPKMGATDYGLRLAQQFGLSITRTYAGLVPFTFSGKQQEDFNEISGVTVPAKVSTNIASFDEGILFTHRGLSGPASLQASSYWKLGENITISLLDESRLETTIKLAKEKEGRKSPHNILTRLLPARLVPKIIKDLELPARIADVDTNQLTKLCNRLSDWQLAPSGTEGYRTAEVMVGGVDTNGLSSKTMMAKNQKGLYFIGECVDVTGWLGGYNFQWAWSSGWVAGQSIRNLL
jgi:predicted Rossmann fold flavoprotein